MGLWQTEERARVRGWHEFSCPENIGEGTIFGTLVWADPGVSVSSCRKSQRPLSCTKPPPNRANLGSLH